LCLPPNYDFGEASTYTDLLSVGVNMINLIHITLEMDGTCAFLGALINGQQVGGYVGSDLNYCGCDDCTTKSWQSSDPGFLSTYVIGGTNQVSVGGASVSTRVTVQYQVRGTRLRSQPYNWLPCRPILQLDNQQMHLSTLTNGD